MTLLLALLMLVSINHSFSLIFAIAMDPSICFLMPYFGQWPEWMSLFLESCRRNASIDWTFFTDCGTPPNAPPNARFISADWADCAQMIQKKCHLSRAPRHAYKICDFRFAFGDIFGDYIRGYDFFGFGDIDVVYGDLRSFLSPEVTKHDLLTFHESHVSGHLTLLRNSSAIVSKYKTYEPWLRKRDVTPYVFLDENIGYYGIEKTYAIEAHSTPLSPYIPWTDGAFRFPSTWYYKDGHLYTSSDGARQFMYLHFFRYKLWWRSNGIRKCMHFPPAFPINNWRLRLDGFYPTAPIDAAQEREEFLDPYDPRTKKTWQRSVAFFKGLFA